ncbi:MAG: DUF2185 domain-containing protein [Lachnospiraceae bacterium]|nr:DUF2185 domain-containing protein [Lachnospiraceae bacterium]
MINKSDYVVVSKKALEEGRIGFAYRDGSRAPKDSGWRMMHIRDEDSLNLANPDKVYACDIRKIIKYFPDLTDILGSRSYSVWEKTGDKWELLGRDKELKLVPHQMSSKSKYAALMTRSGGGAIITSDPKNMRHSRQAEEWEMLLPDTLFSEGGEPAQL